LTAKVPGVDDREEPLGFWPSAAARLSRGFEVAISSSRATAELALCSASYKTDDKLMVGS